MYKYTSNAPMPPPPKKKKIAYFFTKTIKILYPVMKDPWFLTTQKRTQHATRGKQFT